MIFSENRAPLFGIMLYAVIGNTIPNCSAMYNTPPINGFLADRVDPYDD